MAVGDCARFGRGRLSAELILRSFVAAGNPPEGAMKKCETARTSPKQANAMWRAIAFRLISLDGATNALVETFNKENSELRNVTLGSLIVRLHELTRAWTI